MKDGGQAYPCEVWSWGKDNCEWYRSETNEPGISKLEYFAAKAMQGILSDPGIDHPADELSRRAVVLAKAMLTELERVNDGKE